MEIENAIFRTRHRWEACGNNKVVELDNLKIPLRARELYV